MKTIYALRDPITHEIRYVGASRDPVRRWRQHCFDPQGPKKSWVDELVGGNPMTFPELVILEEAVEDWRAAEQHWISCTSSRGNRLFNEQLVR